MARKQPRRASKRGPDLLRGWREGLDLKQQEAADLIGIDLARYNAFEHGRKRPGLDWAFRIEGVSKGAVPADSWVRDPKSIAARAA